MDLKEVMTTAVKAISLIRASHNRHLNFLGHEMEAEYEVLPYHPEIRRHFRGQVIQRLYELREEIFYF